MPKRMSRPARWNEAVMEARNAYDAMIEARDNTSENLQSSETYQKLDAVCDIDLEPDEDDISGMETAIDEAENADLPRGFGRD